MRYRDTGCAAHPSGNFTAKDATMSTIVFVSIFTVLYIFVLFTNAVANRISLIDFLMLSAVALLPIGFELFPRTVERVSALVHVSLPFVLLAGSLFVVVFAYLYRIVIKIQHLKQTNSLLIQELSLLKHRVEQQAAQHRS
jgi:hypothetical protein